ncbi:LysR family transcriptional regulator [Kribbia dieselivorans]|uniref:LysR family transcriptional regulator n=1 Tax=Kribbia dieselivorans TaxID=331526 RepID=UPI000838EF23|nr:LysR family transcriptional regulator [Kribbia dieselivorans]
MDLRLLEYFVAVIDEGGVTKAAQALYIAQPSLSQAIRGLERELGVELFDRSGRSFTLTRAGETFEVGARLALRDADRARARVAAVRDLRAGRLRISAISSLALDPLPQAAALMRRRHPRIQLHISDPGGSVGVVNEVRLGQAELGLCHLDVALDPLVSTPLGEEELALAMVPALAEGLPSPFPLVEVDRLPLVIERGDQAVQTMLGDALEAARAAVVVRSEDRQALWEFVRAGVGAAFLPAHFIPRIRDVVAVTTTPDSSAPSASCIARPHCPRLPRPSFS